MLWLVICCFVLGVSCFAHPHRAETRDLEKRDFDVKGLLDPVVDCHPDRTFDYTHPSSWPQDVKFRMSDEDLFDELPKQHSVAQGTFGDCYFLAAVKAVLVKPWGPGYINRMMYDDGKRVIVKVGGLARTKGMCFVLPKATALSKLKIGKLKLYFRRGVNLLRASDPLWMTILETAHVFDRRYHEGERVREQMVDQLGRVDELWSKRQTALKIPVEFQIHLHNVLFPSSVIRLESAKLQDFLSAYHTRPQLISEKALSDWLYERHVAHAFMEERHVDQQTRQNQMSEIGRVADEEARFLILILKSFLAKGPTAYHEIINGGEANDAWLTLFGHTGTEIKPFSTNYNKNTLAPFRITGVIEGLDECMENIGMQKHREIGAEESFFSYRHTHGVYNYCEEQVFNIIKKAIDLEHPITASVVECNNQKGRCKLDQGTAGEGEKQGLAFPHMYSISDVVTYQGFKYVVVTNPWGFLSRLYVRSGGRKYCINKDLSWQRLNTFQQRHSPIELTDFVHDFDSIDIYDRLVELSDESDARLLPAAPDPHLSYPSPANIPDCDHVLAEQEPLGPILRHHRSSSTLTSTASLVQ